jgi:antitoxin (DNA-binding transcriptional repressor) of toxin-antitoxin stability system
MSESLYNIADFKNQLGEVTAHLEAGEPLLLAKRNVPFARVVPLGKRRNRTELGFGKASVKILGDVESPAIAESDYECLDGSAFS